MIRRQLIPVAAAPVLIAMAWFSVEVYSSRADPEAHLDRSTRSGWIVGPSAPALEAAADRHTREGLRVLNDTSRPATDRLEAFRAELEIADRLLVHGLRARPRQARALARLTAVRWETRPPLDDRSTAEFLEMIATAGRMAPTVPRVQLMLGESLLKMGRRDEALDYLHRAARLGPFLAGPIVTLMRDHLFDAEEIYAALPHDALVLATLAVPHVEDQREDEYLDRVETFFADPGADVTSEILMHYGNVCVRADPARLIDTLSALEPPAAPESESERLRQRARGHVALGAFDLALADARRAAKLHPASYRLREFLADTLFAAGDEDAAVDGYRESLRAAAGLSADAPYRARVYRKIGQVEERRGRIGQAFDAYTMALKLNPDEGLAQRRLATMQGR